MGTRWLLIRNSIVIWVTTSKTFEIACGANHITDHPYFRLLTMIKSFPPGPHEHKLLLYTVGERIFMYTTYFIEVLFVLLTSTLRVFKEFIKCQRELRNLQLCILETYMLVGCLHFITLQWIHRPFKNHTASLEGCHHKDSAMSPFPQKYYLPSILFP